MLCRSLLPKELHQSPLADSWDRPACFHQGGSLTGVVVICRFAQPTAGLFWPFSVALWFPSMVALGNRMYLVARVSRGACTKETRFSPMTSTTPEVPQHHLTLIRSQVLHGVKNWQVCQKSPQACFRDITERVQIPCGS